MSWLCIRDKKGNMITHYDKINYNERRFSWTEDNRLEAVLDNNMGAFYSYDAAGERHYKLTGATVSVSQNGNSVNAPVLDRQTLYASPLITITDKGYTKHYFEEGNRICSSIGSGGFSNIFQHTSPIVSDLKEINRKTNQNAINTYKNNIGVTPYINVTSIYPYIFYNRSTLYKSAPEAVFYYHTDHLGSATLVTDDDADVVQQIAYLPYGEDWVDIRHHGYFGSAYKFNGKEKDDETGYSYYGARYYTDRLSIWLSVDPLADKYPHLSPYVYCADNPVNMVDPDGKEGISVSGSPGNHKNRLHFLENGLARAKQSQKHFQRKGETSTWIIYNDKKNGYSPDLIKEYTKKAEKAGVTVKVMSDVDEITCYINNKNGGNTRATDKITSFFYTGHATPGDLDVGYEGTGQDFDASDLKSSAFSSGTYVDIVAGCRTAVDWGLGILDPSVVKQFSKILDKRSEIRGSDVRVWFDGGVMSNGQLLKKNNGTEIIINGTLDE